MEQSSPQLKYYYRNREEKTMYASNRGKEVRCQLIRLLNIEMNCMRCGFNDIRALQIDHKNGHGHNDRKIFKLSGTSLYRFYLKNPELAKETLQVLCANCNWIKKDENSEHAHPLGYFLFTKLEK